MVHTFRIGGGDIPKPDRRWVIILLAVVLWLDLVLNLDKLLQSHYFAASQHKLALLQGDRAKR